MALRPLLGLNGHWDVLAPAAAKWPIAVGDCVKLPNDNIEGPGVGALETGTEPNAD